LTRTVPVTSYHSPGDYITGAAWNAGPKALGDFILGPPVFDGYQANAQSVASGSWTSLSIDTEILDSDGSHSNITNNTRFTCVVAGTFLFLGTAAFTANSTGVRGSRFALNGTSIRGTQTNTNTCSSSVWAEPCWAVTPMFIGDYVEIQGFQNSGGALNTYNGADCTTSFAAYWIST
jgi:hypothetical protein